ncbi:MAG: 50S ribosomal protein L25 [Lentisphaeria bacterium]|nr:50S ribosomal protein L25 [Lentisphaeria bacterium]
MAKQKHVLNVVTRSELGKGPVKRLRAAGNVPAVIYGKGTAPKNLYFSAAEWEVLQKYELNILVLKEGDNEMLALIKEVQNDFIRGKVKHVDFLEVRRDQVIRATVQVRAGYTAPAGIAQGGELEQDMHEVEVECLPDALPEHLEIDVAALNLGEALHIADVKTADGIKIVSDPELVLFHVVDPAAKAEEAAGEGDATEPEVIGEKEKAERAAAKAAAKK